MDGIMMFKNNFCTGAIHYRSDCEKGLILGKAAGNFAVNRTKTDGAE